MVIIGVDIGKFKHQAIAIDERGKSLCTSFSFENTEEGFNFFFEQISVFQKCKEICIGMETTGHY